jgi:hypothetical protein
MWQGLAGRIWNQQAGTAGTVTLPAGAVIIQIITHASAGAATCAILGGTAIPIINGAPPTTIRFNHDLVQAVTGVSLTVVFTNTDSYFVEYVVAGPYT